MLGIILESMHSEERFLMIEGIAEIARKHFGEAGAIEVFDDLAEKNSSSWDLFSAERPFYFRDELGRSDLTMGLLTEDVESVEPQAKDKRQGNKRQGTLWGAVKSKAKAPFRSAGF